jgi:hypothetical protein
VAVLRDQEHDRKNDGRLQDEVLRDTSSAGMEGPVNFFEVLAIDVCINLRRGNIDVAEHFLNCPKISATLQKMSGK